MVERDPCMEYAVGKQLPD